MDRSRRRLTGICEVIGSTLAIAYALPVASNTGNEVLGFALLLVSSGLFALWAVLDRRLPEMVTLSMVATDWRMQR